MIELRGVNKQYRGHVAIRDLTVTVEPGVVTGFLGPNGAGKSTTIRLIAGLDAPSTGAVLVNCKPFRTWRDPRDAAAELGVLLDGRVAPTGLRARNHLLSLARMVGAPTHRVDELLEIVGLTGVAGDRVRSFSLGMTARLGIAAALLGDPRTVVLDEPMNGLDPEGVIWMRSLLRGLADEGRTVLVSSHLLGEMQLTATRLVVLAEGRLVADTTVDEFVSRAGGRGVRVRSPQVARLREHLRDLGGEVLPASTDDAIEVKGLSAERIGLAAFGIGVAVTELSTATGSLEEAFLSSIRLSGAHDGQAA